jgi:hypothetical protein
MLDPTTKKPYVDIPFGWQILFFKTTKWSKNVTLASSAS